MTNFLEPAKEIPVLKSSEVIVCGGGPAGIAAALSAARAGARTQLIETHGCLGGIWTAGALSWIIDCDNKDGIMREIIQRLEGKGVGRKARGNAFVCDVEEMKLLLEEMCVESGVRIRLHTQVAGTVKKGQRITHVITESKSGREAWEGNIFVDCTGEGDLAAYAGCGFDLGKDGTGQMQPMSLIALVTGLDAEAVTRFNNALPYTDQLTPKKQLLLELQKTGVNPSYQDPSLFHVRDDLFLLMANHEYGYSGLNAQDITDATVHARSEIHAIVNALRSLGGEWRNIRLVATAEQIGIREGRRIHGRYKVTVDDLLRGTRHEDAICNVSFGIDIHALTAEPDERQFEKHLKALPYDIPVRAIIAKDVDGLIMAGRCISGDFIAHSSYRVTGNAVALGNAAGALAAAAAASNKLPHEITVSELRGKL